MNKVELQDIDGILESRDSRHPQVSEKIKQNMIYLRNDVLYEYRQKMWQAFGDIEDMNDLINEIYTKGYEDGKLN